MKTYGPQTQFLTPELLQKTISEYIAANPEIIINAISDYFKANPEILHTELKALAERIELTQLGQAADRKRIRTLEILLGLVEKEEVYNFEENPERLNEIFSKSVLSNLNKVQPVKDCQKMLYEELEKRGSMHNKDILSFFGWNKRYTSRATRLMRSMPEIYKDVECNNVPGHKRALRIYRIINKN